MTNKRWSSISLIVLLIAAPLLIFPGDWRTSALIVLPVIWIGNRLIVGHFVQRSPYDIPILVLLIMILVSLYVTYDISISLPKITGILLGVAAFYAVLGFASDLTRVTVMARLILIGVAAFAALALINTQWGQKIPLLERIGEWLPIAMRGLPGAAEGFHPAEVAGTITWLLFLPVTVAIGSWPERMQPRRWLGAASILGLWLLLILILVLTQSRSGWIGAAAGTGVFLFFLGRRGKRLLTAGLLVGTLVVLIIGPGQILNDLSTAPASDVGTIFTPDFETRTEIWTRAVYGIEDFPLTGMGLGAFRNVLPVLYPVFSIGPDMDIGHAHNEWLQAGVDLGLPGLIAFIALQAMTIALTYRTYRRYAPAGLYRCGSRSPKLIRWIALGILAGIVAHGVFGLTDAVALGAKPGIFLWLLLGLAAAAWRLNYSENMT